MSKLTNYNYNVALIGNPNCGKTTIFNRLTGAQQKVGNWPGVTVEKKTGQYTHQQQNINITDLPGLYSISPAPQNNSVDQQITNNFIKNAPCDLYINILDASNLKRNLYLTLQLKQLGLPCLVVLNMIDKIEFDKLNINYNNLSKILNSPVIALSAKKNTNNLAELKNVINNGLLSLSDHELAHKISADNIFNNIGLNLNSVDNLDLNNQQLNNIITSFNKSLAKINQQTNQINNQKNKNLNLFGLALELIETDLNDIDSEFFNPDLRLALITAKQQIQDLYQEDPDIVIADLRYKIINIIYQNIIIKANISNQKIHNHQKTSNILDNLVLNKYLGIPIFLLLLYTTFELSINLGGVFKPLFEQPSNFISQQIILAFASFMQLPSTLTTHLAGGLATGVSTVTGFIPQIAIMFMLLACLEDSGYMARAAFVMDKFMQTIGLPGKSFLPLIISFGCNVPAILSTRTLHNYKDRILTCIMSPFMSCSARLAIFMVFATSFFPNHKALMVFILYLTGIIAALITGLILKRTILLDDKTPFILELPSYNLPNIKNIITTSWQHSKGFVIRAGKLIIPICIILQLLNSIQVNGQWLDNNNIDKSSSVLARFSKTITPALHPIGITDNNWPATVGLITGSLAKEVVIGTLNTLYSDPIDTTNTTAPEANASSFYSMLSTAATESLNLFSNLFSRSHYNIEQQFASNFSNNSFSKLNQAFPSAWAAFAYCLFVLLYMPCLSTFSMLIKEIGNKWAMMSLIWSLDIAYCSATIVYQLSNIYLTPVKTITIISFIIISHRLGYLYLRSGKLNNYFNAHNQNSNQNHNNAYITTT